jgi:hypothetical protein
MAYLHKDWFTPEEAARYADVTATMLRDWRKNGLPKAKVGGRTYRRCEKLDAFIASHQGNFHHVTHLCKIKSRLSP